MATAAPEMSSIELDPALAADPVWQAFLRAPLGPPETEEQKRMSAEAMRGPFTSSAEMSAAIAARCPPGR